ncbi:MAG: hypothetical protein ACXABY_01270 [Candidatus Thorarchaeota archaeon]|jgi:hypothetical protein
MKEHRVYSMLCPVCGGDSMVDFMSFTSVPIENLNGEKASCLHCETEFTLVIETWRSIGVKYKEEV